ncbi:MAG: hypothetical protein GY801_09230 [bacterium]|nr:hypothetical protein [bacterium]
MATEFKQEMDRINALVVLTVVPYRNTQIGHLAYLSEKLGVTVVLPPFDGLRLSDGSHLNRESARRFSKMFWDEFIATPEIRKRLLDRPDQSPQPGTGATK